MLLSNSVHLLRESALEHSGIVCLPTLVASEAVLSGQLRVVLPDFPLSAFWLSIFYPATLRGSLKLRLFLEVLKANFSGTPPWDQALIAKGFLTARVLK